MSTTILEPPIRVFKFTEGFSTSSTPRNRTAEGGLSSSSRIESTRSTPRQGKQSRYEVPQLSFDLQLENLLKMHDTIESVVMTLREPIADIQEKRGISRNQHFSFIDLMTAMFNHTYYACMAIVTMVIGLMPLVEGFLLLVRFVLDKVLEINDTENMCEKIFKSVIFLGELIIIFIFVTIVLTVVLLPVYHLVRYVLHKGWAIMRY
ncbi:PREDICTED: uncharacterized protein LOC108556521 isoform X2 [Nicrophorus vespilloides]|uniref:Uncharacterized protein LOC108556521 isoform X2 n=1 Tax=Nicrophorus vespilloides TaxID=110193 RepID=A0ABM1M0R0_NICVS|nr:PREDICTED: uncharacterized protein LOC108556521 isoform X2 [Nicrophorus vespilloides]